MGQGWLGGGGLPAGGYLRCVELSSKFDNLSNTPNIYKMYLKPASDRPLSSFFKTNH